MVSTRPPWAHALLRRTYQTANPKPAQRLLLDVAWRLEAQYPSAADSVREGLEDTLTVLTPIPSPGLRRSLVRRTRPRASSGSRGS